MQVPKQLRESFLDAVKAGRIRSMQNKLMPAAPIHTPGALLLGDAFNMRHPLTGQHLCIACCAVMVQGAAVLQPLLELSKGVLPRVMIRAMQLCGMLQRLLQLSNGGARCSLCLASLIRC